ncbi:uncharacterized protein ptx4 [Aplochiton taeniatus]
MLSLRAGRLPLLLVVLVLQLQLFRVETGAHPELRTPVYQRLQRMDQQFQQFQLSTLARLNALSQNQNTSLGLVFQVQTLTDQYHRISEDLDHLRNTTTQEIYDLRDSSRKLEKKSKRMEGRLASLERSLRLSSRHAHRQSPELGHALSNLTLELRGQEGRLTSFEAQREELLSGLRGLQESLKDQELWVRRVEGRLGEALQWNRGVLGQELPLPVHPRRPHQNKKKPAAQPEGPCHHQNHLDPESRPQPYQVWPDRQPQTQPSPRPAKPRQTNDRRMRTRPPSVHPTQPPTQPQEGLRRLGHREQHWPWMKQVEDKDRSRGVEKQKEMNVEEMMELERRRGEGDGGMTRGREYEEHKRGTAGQIKEGSRGGEEEKNGEGKTNSSTIQNILQLPVSRKIPLRQVPTKDETICNVHSMLIFPSASPENYVTFSRSFPNLPELSVCLWLRAEADYVGTLLSYATDDNDNQLVLYGRSSSPPSSSSSSSSSASPSLDFVVGDPVHRQLPADSLSDGDWHHLCVLWSSIQGRFWHYSDRRLTSTGSKFRKGYEVAGGGSVVLGQEQDVAGGGFDVAEAFVGRMAGFIVWDRVLSSREVEGVAEGRGVPRGVVLTLGDVDRVHGEVEQVACECLEHCI